MTNTTTQTMTKVTGDTFAARNVLKTAGFVFDADRRCWLGTDEAKAELDRITRASYSRSNLKACRGLVIETL